jgi:hypothetical protein
MIFVRVETYFNMFSTSSTVKHKGTSWNEDVLKPSKGDVRSYFGRGLTGV